MMPRLKQFGWVAFLSSFPAILFYAYLYYSETGLFPSLEKNVSGFLTSIFIGIVLGVALYTLNKLLDRWIPWRNFFSSRFLAGYASNMIISLLVVLPLTTRIINSFRADVFWKG